jgi:RNA polymerase sigma-70 factor, ECF subfamily
MLAACRLGDRRAFEELVHITNRRVFSLAYRLVGDRHDAEDVAQDAYLRMFQGLDGFREEARFETWMYRIVTNSAMNLLRRRGRFGEIARDEDLDEPIPDRPSEQAVERDVLARALEGLPAGQRTVLWLKDVYGLSCREIGDELDLEEGAVKVRLHRARKRLKEFLQEDWDEVPAGKAVARVARRRGAGA